MLEIVPVNSHASEWLGLREIVKPVQSENSEYVYVIRLMDGTIKMGRTSHLMNRMISYFISNGKCLDLLYVIKTRNAYELEKHILKNLNLLPVRGKEYFEFSDLNVSIILEHAKSFVEIVAPIKLHGVVKSTPVKHRKKDLDAYPFIAQMDSMGRLRIPARGREAKGYEPGMRFNVTIVKLEDNE